MKNLLATSLLLALLCACNKNTSVLKAPDNGSKSGQDVSADVLAKMSKQAGYLDFYWDDEKGKLLLAIDKLDEELLYVNSLAAGVGSNDIGLDRGQLGSERVVKFTRVGPKVLLTQINYGYRAVSDNEAERKSVEEAFAQSVLWGFKVEGESDGKVMVDATPFLLNDAHDVSGRLKTTKQGLYKLDASRSAVYIPRCKAFPKNIELEATLTFVGKPTGAYIRDVTPTPEVVTVRQHHSFIELPDDNYKPRVFDPRSGYFANSYQDYATPIDEPLVKRFITRHRLSKVDPAVERSRAVEPIIYYLDPGAPEPVRSALLDGARWWNQAFEAAGYEDAFQVKILPTDADPMDVRYNVIQWVHRATRGWSYGASVIDPRTGEIIKGHVSLGSLRVRQDFLIAQGLLAPYKEGEKVSDEMQEMALARLRQLSAHEVGHTIGLAHNFAASYNDRSSVMDYPYPLVTLREDGSMDFSNAYDDKIGSWDKRSILYGYQDFPANINEEEGLKEILSENDKLGLRYISDADARPLGGAHPYAHLWDNGKDAVEEFKRLATLRKKALGNFGENNIPMNEPMSTLEEVLVPIYLSHRFQIEAVSKLIAGVDYSYGVRGGERVQMKIVDDKKQQEAIDILIESLGADFLKFPKKVLELIPPKPIGYPRTRESFKSRTGVTFDPMAAAESSAHTTLKALLHPERANRLVQHYEMGNSNISFQRLLEELFKPTFSSETNGYGASLNRMVYQLSLDRLMSLATDKRASSQVQANCLLAIQKIENSIGNINSDDEKRSAHRLQTQEKIKHFKRDPSKWEASPSVKMPAGSPIGCGAQCGH